MKCEGRFGVKKGGTIENTGLAMTPSGYNITTHSILSRCRINIGTMIDHTQPHPLLYDAQAKKFNDVEVQNCAEYACIWSCLQLVAVRTSA